MNRQTPPPASALPSHRRGRRVFALSGVAALFMLAGLVVSPDAASQGPDGYQVIVNAKNPANAASRELLSDIFLKRASRWDTSESAFPVDLRSDSPVRKAFSRAVLARPVAAVRSYWTQRIFAGRDVPPPELQSDEAVSKFVAGHTGAVGYVSPSTAPAAGTKRLEVR